VTDFIPLTPGASFDVFLKRAMDMPRLEKEEENRLFNLWKDTGDRQAYDRIFLGNVRLVEYMVDLYIQFGPLKNDLFQAGLVGLSMAINKFDPKHGLNLGLYASQWIKAEIRNYIVKNMDIVQVATGQNYRKLFFKLRPYLRDGRWLTSEERDVIAVELEVPVKAVAEMEQRLSITRASLLDTDPGDDFASDGTQVKPIADDRPTPEDIVEAWSDGQMDKRTVDRLMASLNDRERYVIHQRFLRNEAFPKVTLKALSEELGVTTERVRQMEVKALKKMRQRASAIEGSEDNV